MPKPSVTQVFFVLGALFFLFVLSRVHIDIQTGSVAVERVRFITPDTYFPPEIQVKHRNTGEEPIRSIRHTVEYRSPVVDTTYWTRDIICHYDGDGLRPGEAYNSRCEWKDGNIPPTRNPTDRKPNAALFFTDVSVSSVVDSTGM